MGVTYVVQICEHQSIICPAVCTKGITKQYDVLNLYILRGAIPEHLELQNRMTVNAKGSRKPAVFKWPSRAFILLLDGNSGHWNFP